MSRPSISIPPLPPNLFFTSAILLLTLSATTTATPTPMTGPHGIDHPNQNSTSNTLDKSTPLPPLTSKQIAAVVCGVVFGVLAVWIIGYAMMHLSSLKSLVSSRGKETKSVDEVVVGKETKVVEWDGMTDVDVDETQTEEKACARVSVMKVSSAAVSEVTIVSQGQGHVNKAR